MALTDKLTAIGDAIRSKTGGSDLLTLDEMPQEIQSIQTSGDGGASEEIDDVTLTVVINSDDSSDNYAGPLIEEYETDTDCCRDRVVVAACLRLYPNTEYSVFPAKDIAGKGRILQFQPPFNGNFAIFALGRGYFVGVCDIFSISLSASILSIISVSPSSIWFTHS